MLVASPGILVLEDVLMGAFTLFVATGAMEPQEAILNKPRGPRESVTALLEALRWRYPGETCGAGVGGCIGARRRMSLLDSLLAPQWEGGPAKGGRCCRAGMGRRVEGWC